MEATERFAKARARLDKAEQFISRMALLTKLIERVMRDTSEVEARLIDAIRTGPREAAVAQRKNEQLATIRQRTEAIGRNLEVASQNYHKAVADPEKLVENLDDPTLDEFLDGALARIEKSQDDLEKQIFELQAMTAELDRALNKKSPAS
jgi:hypothetical protein